jgi:ATP-binding cassette subfamily C protein
MPLPMRQTGSDNPLANALRGVRRHFAWAAAFSALLNLLFLAPTLYMLQVYDRVVPTQGHATLIFLTLVVLFALLTLSLLDLVRSRLLVRASVRLDRMLAGAILDSSLARHGHSMSKQAMREFDLLRQTLTGNGILALLDAPWTPIYILVCFLVHPYIGLVALFGTILLVFLAWRNEKATREPLQDANEAAKLSYVSQEQSVASADVIRAFGMRRAMISRHLKQRQQMMELQTQASFSGGGYVAATKFTRMALQSLALGLGGYLAINNEISGGAIFASSFLAARAMAPIEQVLGAWKGIIQGRSAYQTLSEMFAETPPDISLTQLPPPKGNLLVEQLYVLGGGREQPILQNITFKVDAGQVIGVIGPSGAGKSTLMRVIAGAQTPDRGSIRFDGAEQKDWDPEELSRHIGYLPQEPSLFQGTVKENISRFRGELGEGSVDAETIEAAQVSSAHELVLRLPGGYDYQLGWGGKGLSAGQAQRVALARALYASPSLVILDEPNAHLDAEGDAQLIKTIGDLKQRGTTVLVVAHRLSILPVVDRLLVIRDGKMEMYGPREEVLARLSPKAPQQTVAQAPAAQAKAIP